MKKQEDGPARGTWHIYSRGTEERLFNRLFIIRKFLHQLVQHLSEPAWKEDHQLKASALKHCNVKVKMTMWRWNVPVLQQTPWLLQCSTAAHGFWPCPVKPAQHLRKLIEMKDEHLPMSKWPWLIPSPERETLIFTQCNLHQLRPVRHLLPQYTTSTAQNRVVS